MSLAWRERLKIAFDHTNGYDHNVLSMRRSLQSVILYEAKRCIDAILPTVQPYQRKSAYLDQCYALLESLIVDDTGDDIIVDDNEKDKTSCIEKNCAKRRNNKKNHDNELFCLSSNQIHDIMCRLPGPTGTATITTLYPSTSTTTTPVFHNNYNEEMNSSCKNNKAMAPTSTTTTTAAAAAMTTEETTTTTSSSSSATYIPMKPLEYIASSSTTTATGAATTTNTVLPNKNINSFAVHTQQQQQRGHNCYQYSFEPMEPECAWKRYKTIERELDKLCTELKPFVVTSTSASSTSQNVNPEQQHQQAVTRMVQHLFERTNGTCNYRSNTQVMVEEELEAVVTQAQPTVTADKQEDGGNVENNCIVKTNTTNNNVSTYIEEVEQKPQEQIGNEEESHSAHPNPGRKTTPATLAASVAATNAATSNIHHRPKILVTSPMNNHVVGRYPFQWEHQHNSSLVIFRMYFIGDQVDPDFPLPISPRKLVIPVEKQRRPRPIQRQHDSRSFNTTVNKNDNNHHTTSKVHPTNDTNIGNINNTTNDDNATAALVRSLQKQQWNVTIGATSASTNMLPRQPTPILDDTGPTMTGSHHHHHHDKSTKPQKLQPALIQNNASYTSTPRTSNHLKNIIPTSTVNSKLLSSAAGGLQMLSSQLQTSSSLQQHHQHHKDDSHKHTSSNQSKNLTNTNTNHNTLRTNTNYTTGNSAVNVSQQQQYDNEQQYYIQSMFPLLTKQQQQQIALIDYRRKALAEIREHIDLLNEFHGIVSEDDIRRRKRELFLALPQAPSPTVLLLHQRSNNNNISNSKDNDGTIQQQQQRLVVQREGRRKSNNASEGTTRTTTASGNSTSSGSTCNDEASSSNKPPTKRIKRTTSTTPAVVSVAATRTTKSDPRSIALTSNAATSGNHPNRITKHQKPLAKATTTTNANNSNKPIGLNVSASGTKTKPKKYKHVSTK